MLNQIVDLKKTQNFSQNEARKAMLDMAHLSRLPEGNNAGNDDVRGICRCNYGY